MEEKEMPVLVPLLFSGTEIVHGEVLNSSFHIERSNGRLLFVWTVQPYQYDCR